MSNESPAAILFNRDGYDIAISDGYSIIPEQSGIIIAGKNGSTAKFITLDGYGQTIVVGAGSAGSPSGGIITIQGIVGGQAIPVSQNGTWTIQQGTPPWSIIGTSSDDSANTSAKLPILSARANAISPSWTENNQVPLSTFLTGQLRTDITSWLGSTIPTIGQKTMSNSIPVTIASDQSTLLVGGTSDGYDRVPFKTDIDGNLNVIINTVSAGADAQITYGDILLSSITTVPIRRTAYTEPTVDFTGSIVSSSAADTAAGTGARSVRIYWMNSTGVSIGTEDVILNGTTNVNLATSTKCFIEKMEVLTAGSGGVNAGTITLRTGLGGGGTIVGTIAIGNNKTFWAHHYVQSGKVCNINGIIAGSTSSTVGGGSSYFLRAKLINVANTVEKQVSDTIQLYGQANQIVRNYITAIPVAMGPSRIIMYVTTQANTSYTYRGSFDYIDN